MFAIIGGSGFYELDGYEVVERMKVDTPYGAPSSDIMRAKHESGSEVLFIARHGAEHRILPSQVNYRANIWALKKCGARQVAAVSACGSLREDIKPGQFVLPAQYFDHTRGRRISTFFGDGPGEGLAAYTSTARPVCAQLSGALAKSVQACGGEAHENRVYACVEGPRLGTRAESFFLRDSVKADVVGMTNIPEVFLAREAQLSYATLAVVTDYDCWLDNPDEDVTVRMVLERFGKSIALAKQAVGALGASPPPVDEEHRCALKDAVLTPPDAQSAAHKELLAVLGA